MAFSNNENDTSIFEQSTLENELQGTHYDEIVPSESEKRKLAEIQKNIDVINKRVVAKNALTRTAYKIDYAHELNPEQVVAVSIIDKPLLVIAGAGTGKTRVIVYKVAYLIENNIPPQNILLLTFTRKAAKEMMDKVHNLLHQSPEQSRVFGGTFHSFSARILRIYSEMIDLKPFTILDTDDMKNLIDLVRKENGFTQRNGIPFPKKNTLQNIISRANNLEKTISEIISLYFEDEIHPQYIEDIEQLNILVQEYKQEHNMLDYDDLMIKLCYYLKHHTHFRKSIQQRFQYVLVDEYQDTNNKQREIIELIVGDRNCVTVVGDDAQSIYGFRGANYENILRFYESFPDCVSVKIQENYRSTKEILDFTNKITKNNQLIFNKDLRSVRNGYIKPVAYQAPDQLVEARYIVEKLQQEKQMHLLEYSDFAVLTRSSWHSVFVQAELAKHNIPFIVVGGIKFHEKRHIKDVISFLKIIVNPYDTIAWHRILNLIEGVGSVRASDIVAHIVAQNGSIDFSAFSNQKYYDALQVYETLYKHIQDKKPNPQDALKKVLTMYIPLLETLESDFKVRVIDLELLVTLAGEYKSLNSFLENFSLDPPNTYKDNMAIIDNKHKDVVVVSTVHSAKGLEWNTVFIPHLVDGLFPSSRAMVSLEDIEEERRVFYVATSRAKERLFLTIPAYISSSGGYEFTKPSRFITELGTQVFTIDDSQ